MTAGSAVVSPDLGSFGNLHAYKDEIVPGCAALRMTATSWALP